MRWTDSAKTFLGALASQDMMLIQPLLEDNVKLSSWSCDVSGKHETMIAIQNLFDFVDNIIMRQSRNHVTNIYFSLGKDF